jgi:cyclopropane-fatty-acyl-phospholipid synthase
VIGARLLDDLCTRGVRRWLSAMGNPALRVALWNGAAVSPPGVEPVGTVRIRDRGALLRLLADPEMQVGELYTERRIELEGDLLAMTRAVYEGGIDRRPGRRWLPWGLLDCAQRRRDPAPGRESAQHHYDVDNDFYRLWLDERMVYTCAYFHAGDDTLEDAQLQKLDHVCRKLRLREGERVIEAGCGWGALALHMARYYGARVRAFNVSRAQLEVAREQAEKQGLSHRVEFIEDDYREITGACEKFVAVGLLEHVGTAHYRELGAVIGRCLTRDGIGLLHSVGASRPLRLNRWIERRIFPNAQIPRLREMMDLFEPCDLAVLDVENLRRHYALTLRHWLRRYDAAAEAIEARVGPGTARAWRLYLAGCAGGFAAGYLELFQIVFARAGNLAIPWTRAHLYAGDDGAL